MSALKDILLLEDDHVDAMTVKRALEELKVGNNLVIKENGEDGLAYLRNGKNKPPCLILLDLNMPKMNGVEFLKILKQDEIFKMIPVVVLTTSREEQDRLESFKTGVAGYMLKPVDYQKFVEVIKAIQLYWMLSELPPTH